MSRMVSDSDKIILEAMQVAQGKFFESSITLKDEVFQYLANVILLKLKNTVIPLGATSGAIIACYLSCT